MPASVSPSAFRYVCRRTGDDLSPLPAATSGGLGLLAGNGYGGAGQVVIVDRSRRRLSS